MLAFPAKVPVLSQCVLNPRPETSRQTRSFDIKTNTITLETETIKNLHRDVSRQRLISKL